MQMNNQKNQPINKNIFFCIHLYFWFISSIFESVVSDSTAEASVLQRNEGNNPAATQAQVRGNTIDDIGLKDCFNGQQLQFKRQIEGTNCTSPIL